MKSKSNLSEYHLSEIEKCKNDPIYFINKYACIDKRGELAYISLREYQKSLLELYDKNKFSIVSCARQVGETTTTILYILWNICFNPYKEWYIITSNSGSIRLIKNIIDTIHTNLPEYLKPSVINVEAVYENEHTPEEKLIMSIISFSNGSKIYCKILTENSTFPNYADNYYINNMAFIPKEFLNIEHINKIVEFYSKFEKDSKLILTSFPTDLDGTFAEIYFGSKEGKYPFESRAVNWNTNSENVREYKIMSPGLADMLMDFSSQIIKES